MATAASRRRSDSQSSYGSRNDGRRSGARIIDSDEESIEERISDDDLLTNFNVTSQKKKSYLKSSRDNDEYATAKDDKMLMTMRKPWQPNTGSGSTSPRAARRLDSVEERYDRQRERERSGDRERDRERSEDRVRDRERSVERERDSEEWEEASYRRTSTTERGGSNSINRAKSPVVRSPRSLKDSIESLDLDERLDAERPRAASRQRKSAQDKSRTADDDDEVVVRPSSRAARRGRSPDQPAISSYRSEQSESPPRHNHYTDVSDSRKKDGSGRSTPELKGDHKPQRSASGRSTPSENKIKSNGGRMTPEMEEGRRSRGSLGSQHRPSSRASESPRERRRKSSKDEKVVHKGSVLDHMTDEPSPADRHSTYDYMADGVKQSSSDRQNRSRRSSRESVKAEGESSCFQETVREPEVKQEESSVSGRELKSEDKLKPGSEKPVTEKQRQVNETLEMVSHAQTSSPLVTPAPRHSVSKPPHQKSSTTAVSLHKTAELKPRPRSRYAQPRPPSARAQSSTDVSSFGSTTDIRNAIFEEWTREAEKRKKLQQAEEKRKQEEKLEKEKRNNKNDPEKVIEIQASYNAWAEKKKEFIKVMTRKKKEEEEQKRLKEEEKREKKKDAEMNFLKWKEQKDSQLQDNHNKKLREERRKEQQKKEKEQEKHQESKSAYNKWFEEKEDEIRAQKREIRNHEMRQREMERLVKEEKKADARRLYVEWLQQKEEQQEAERRRKNLEEEDDERRNRRPWRPSSHNVQFGRA